MYGRAGLERFKKAQSVEPFQVSLSSSPGTTGTSQSTSRAAAVVPKSSSVQYPQATNLNPQTQNRTLGHDSLKPAIQEAAPLLGQTNLTQIGGGQSTWQPPDWAIEPRPGVYCLEVMKDGEVLDRISLDRRRQIFGRQIPTCDFVLDHQSVSRQHAAVIPHKNGSIYVIDLGSAHGTFVANERLTKDTPMELEVGQSLKFAASTRTYILRKNNAALFPPTASPAEINLPPPPDPSDEEAVVTYNTLLNRYSLGKAKSDDPHSEPQRPAKRARKQRVTFRDHAGEKLAEVVGMSDGADVGTEPGPIGVKEGSLVGKYESLVQSTVIPKGKEQTPMKEDNRGQKGVTDRLQEMLDKVKNPTTKGGIYDDLYGGDSLKVGSSWAFPQNPGSTKTTTNDPSNAGNSNHGDDEDDDDDLFGD